MLTGDYLENVMIQLTIDDARKIYDRANADVACIPKKMETVDCPLCSSKNKEHLIDTRGQGCLAQCKDCNVIYAYERPTLEVTNALYRYYLPTNITDVEIRKSQLVSRPKELNEDIDVVECYTDRGNLLDVGAASGDFLVYARVRGWQVEATELSALCADFMAKTLNLRVLLGNILNIEFEKGKYNAITLRHCVEHLRSPIEELKVLYNALDDNGILFITTPEHAQDLELVKKHNMLPLHLVNYTDETLTNLLERTGFKKLSYESLETEGDDRITNMRVIAVKEC